MEEPLSKQLLDAADRGAAGRDELTSWGAQAYRLEAVHDDFCNCYELANRMDSDTPEEPSAFIGSVSERLTAAFTRLEKHIRQAQLLFRQHG